MSLGIKLFWIITASELLLWLIPSFRIRRILAAIILIGLLTASGLIVYLNLNIAALILLSMSLYRAGNLFRLIKARMQKQYLDHVTAQTGIWIILLQAIYLLSWQLGAKLDISSYYFWLGLLVADAAAIFILLGNAVRQILKTKVPDYSTELLADRDFPTLTVAIPARNETIDLEACLKSLIESNYPKLEIIVLDDCSQDKRTPDIIRNYAQDGVRFVQGKPPEDNLLAKNFAYQQLVEESNGELLLFCGVDVRFHADSLRQLVLAMLFKQKSMISIIPKNIIDKDISDHHSILLQPIRYAWEVALPRKIFHRPAVLSTCWIIKRKLLETTGGFGAVSRSIVPESYFARASALDNGYSFMQSNEAIGISSHKGTGEQKATFVRTRYPQLHRRMELVLIVMLVEVIGIFTPYVMIVIAIFGRLPLQLTIVSIITIIGLSVISLLMVRLTYRKLIFRSVLLPPLFAIIDVSLLNYSMFRYEFSTVIWKGRNICIPIMHVTDQLTETGS